MSISRTLKALVCVTLMLGAAQAQAQAPAADELSQAIRKADTAAVRALLGAGAPVRERDRSGFAPLVTTVLVGAHKDKTAAAIDIAQALLDAGADIEQEGPVGNAPLSTACGQTRGTEMVAFLLQRGARVNARGYNGTFPLYQAVRKNHAAAAALLMEHGADVKARNADGQTALHHAALNGMEKTVELLLARGADIHARDAQGKTALSWARGDIPGDFVGAPAAVPSMVELLKRHGAKE